MRIIKEKEKETITDVNVLQDVKDIKTKKAFEEIER